MLHAIESRPELLLRRLLPQALLHSRLSPPLPPLFALLQVLVQAGAYVKDDACRALILLVVNAAQLHAYAARASYRALTANLEAAQPSLLMVATWCLGAGGSRRVEQRDGLGWHDRMTSSICIEALAQPSCGPSQFGCRRVRRAAGGRPGRQAAGGGGGGGRQRGRRGGPAGGGAAGAWCIHHKQARRAFELDTPACPVSHCLPTPIPSPLFLPFHLPACPPQRPSTSAAVREYTLTALAKLEPKFGGQAQRIKGLIASFAQASSGGSVGGRLGWGWAAVSACSRSNRKEIQRQINTPSLVLNAPSLVLAPESCFAPTTLASWRRARSWRCRRAAWSTPACLHTQPSAHRRAGWSAGSCRDGWRCLLHARRLQMHRHRRCPCQVNSTLQRLCHSPLHPI